MICIKQSSFLNDKHLQVGKKLNINSSRVEMVEALKEIYQGLNVSYPKFFKMDKMSKSAFLAAEGLMSCCNTLVEKEKIGVFLMNKSASLDTDENYFEKTFTPGEIKPNPALFVYTLPNIMLGELSIRHGFKGEQAMWIGDQFDVQNLVNYVTLLFEEQRINGAIVGWVEFYRGVQNVFLSWVERISDNPEAFAEFTSKNVESIYNKINRV